MGPTTLSSGISGAVPQFPVALSPPDLHPWLAGNTGIPGVTRLCADAPGPTVVLLGLLHGNEIAGAIVLDRLMREDFGRLAGH